MKSSRPKQPPIVYTKYLTLPSGTHWKSRIRTLLRWCAGLRQAKRLSITCTLNNRCYFSASRCISRKDAQGRRDRDTHRRVHNCFGLSLDKIALKQACPRQKHALAGACHDLG